MTSLNPVIVEVEIDGQTTATVVPRQTWVEVNDTGRQGPPGPPGSNGGDSATIEYEQTTPSADWSFAVPPQLNRTPNVAVYVDGRLVLADVQADSETVNISFPSPTVGSVVLA